jgi:hypothetical protein
VHYGNIRETSMITNRRNPDGTEEIITIRPTTRRFGVVVTSSVASKSNTVTSLLWSALGVKSLPRLFHNQTKQSVCSSIRSKDLI